MSDIALSPDLLASPGMRDSSASKQSTGTKAELYQKAKQLEGLFLNTLVSEMFKDVNARGMFGGGYAEETWRSMQATQVSQQIADSGGVGLADDIMHNLLSLQESVPVDPTAKAPQKGA